MSAGAFFQDYAEITKKFSKLGAESIRTWESETTKEEKC